jgi:hypothetical protein
LPQDAEEPRQVGQPPGFRAVDRGAGAKDEAIAPDLPDRHEVVPVGVAHGVHGGSDRVSGPLG